MLTIELQAALDTMISDITAIENADTRKTADGFVESGRMTKEQAEEWYNNCRSWFEQIKGRKYIKIARCGSGSRSAWGFIDTNGDIYKAASWAAPAKGKRGNVIDYKKATHNYPGSGLVFVNYAR